MWVCYPQTSNPKIGFITNKMHFQQCIAKRQNMKSNKQWISANSHISYLVIDIQQKYQMNSILVINNQYAGCNITVIGLPISSLKKCFFLQCCVTFSQTLLKAMSITTIWSSLKHYQTCHLVGSEDRNIRTFILFFIVCLYFCISILHNLSTHS